MQGDTGIADTATASLAAYASPPARIEHPAANLSGYSGIYMQIAVPE
jgi:hypothetical protein